NINSLSNSVMQQLAKRGDVALEMEYTYDGVDYHIVIPAGLAVDDDIPWYGPLYLSAYYSGYALSENTAAPTSLYIVQSGDTLSKIARKHNTTVADLTMKNPQIKNVNSIKPGQIITIE
ncbi:MAG: LysM peptidoglycan-binding domain-containing protein, partial [Acetatifactor sp.]|nr:LysM peptidoglycan-binding domain-containing protein [Acetatifactor sp.]